MNGLYTRFGPFAAYALSVFFLTNTGFGDSSNVDKNSQVRISVVQQETIPGAVQANREKALNYARSALKNDVDVILFHEALTVGYVENIHELAEPTDGLTTRAFQKLLHGTGTIVIYGLVECDGDNYYTSAVIVGAKGVIAKYRKTHLWWDAKGTRHEPSYFQPGKRLVTFDVKGHKSGVMICYDGDFPEMTRAYANLDCTMLFWMNNRGERGFKEVYPLVRANSIVVATSCCCGKNELGYDCRGGSNIIDAEGSLLTEIWEKEGIIYADVQPGKVMNIRNANPWYKGQRQNLYRQ